MAFLIDDAVYEKFPGMALVVAVGRGVDNAAPRPDVVAALRQAEDRLRESFGFPAAAAHPRIAAWRAAQAGAGIPGGKFPCAVEALTKRVLMPAALPDINPLVNFYNKVSLDFLVPVGGWDLDGLHDQVVHLKITRGGEPFTELGKGQTVQAGPGEVGYATDGALITRHFVWRQAETAKITPSTTAFFLVSEILPEVGDAVAEAVRGAFASGLEDLFGVPAETAVLEPGRTRWDWSTTPRA